MLKVSIIDSGVEELMATLDWLQVHLKSGCKGIEYMPCFRVKPVSISELKFSEDPDLLIIGAGLASGNINDIAHIRKVLPELPLIVIATEGNFSVDEIECLSRIGVSEILSSDITTEELLRRLVILILQAKRKVSGNLVVVDATKAG